MQIASNLYVIHFHNILAKTGGMPGADHLQNQQNCQAFARQPP
jgi:hypothetical protein